MVVIMTIAIIQIPDRINPIIFLILKSYDLFGLFLIIFWIA